MVYPSRLLDGAHAGQTAPFCAERELRAKNTPKFRRSCTLGVTTVG